VGSGPAILGLRLKIDDRKISEIEAIVLRSIGRGVFSDVKALKVDPIMTQPLAPSEKRTRDEPQGIVATSAPPAGTTPTSTCP